MYTVRNFVSDIRSMSKLISSDQLITDRVIANEGRSAANLIVGQILEKRKLWNSPNLFAYIPCLEMEEVPLSECCEYTSEKKVAKSKKKLPKIAEGFYGLAIQAVLGLDGNKEFKEVTPKRYANLLKLGLPGNQYFWIQNDHLYVSNEHTKAIHMYAFFTEDIPNDLLFSPNCKCVEKPNIADLCTNPLDKLFYCPANRLDDVKNIVYNKLLKIYFNVSEDKTSNNQDETTK